MLMFTSVFQSKKSVPSFDPTPEILSEMPVRPYLVLHADLPFYSDPECKVEVQDARLIVIRSEDPKQQHHPVECLPTRKRYENGQILRWDINHKTQWADAWYRNPGTGVIEKAWVRSVEFIGPVVKI